MYECAHVCPKCGEVWAHLKGCHMDKDREMLCENCPRDYEWDDDQSDEVY